MSVDPFFAEDRPQLELRVVPMGAT
jgi:hypothetical protein